jgi:hypothetical protein
MGTPRNAAMRTRSGNIIAAPRASASLNVRAQNRSPSHL